METTNNNYWHRKNPLIKYCIECNCNKLMSIYILLLFIHYLLKSNRVVIPTSRCYYYSERSIKKLHNNYVLHINCSARPHTYQLYGMQKYVNTTLRLLSIIVYYLRTWIDCCKMLSELLKRETRKIWSTRIIK